MKKAVRIFTGFCQKYIRTADPDISADGGQNAAHRDSRICVFFHKNRSNHRSGRGLSVGPGHCDGSLVVAHKLPQKLGAGEHGKLPLFCLGVFRIVRMNGRRVYHQLTVLRNIGGRLADLNPGA